MGFLGIIPADKLAALYDTSKRQLVLFASGEVREFAYGFNFKRDAWMGGLKFTLMAWSGPIGQKMQKYDHRQAFSIGLPSPVYPSGKVIIVTANHPEGVEVPIRFTGLKPEENTGKLEAASDSETASLAKHPVAADVLPGHTRLNVLYKTQFNVKAAANVPKGGSVDIAFDTKYVQLVNTSIQDGEIVWTFFANEMGNTEIVVTTHGGIATYVMQQTYDVYIFVL